MFNLKSALILKEKKRKKKNKKQENYKVNMSYAYQKSDNRKVFVVLNGYKLAVFYFN